MNTAASFYLGLLASMYLIRETNASRLPPQSPVAQLLFSRQSKDYATNAIFAVVKRLSDNNFAPMYLPNTDSPQIDVTLDVETDYSDPHHLTSLRVGEIELLAPAQSDGSLRLRSIFDNQNKVAQEPLMKKASELFCLPFEQMRYRNPFDTNTRFRKPLASRDPWTFGFQRRVPMEPDRHPVAFEPFFGGFVLETLTVGMYGEARNAIREYIQNGFDSIQRGICDLKQLPKGQGLIEIELSEDRDRLTIRDNGAGLPVRTAATVLTRVGASTKSHRKNAGFRGIGRLAGIVFSDTVTFSTKAKGENEQSTVIFDAKAMRVAMGPTKGSKSSAVDVMNQSVTAYRTPNDDVNAHFFEVRLEGFTDAPDECRSATKLYDFVSQVAPVAYPREFPYRNQVEECGRLNQEFLSKRVGITIRDGNEVRRNQLQRRYVDKFSFDSGTVFSKRLFNTSILQQINGGPGLEKKRNQVRTPIRA